MYLLFLPLSFLIPSSSGLATVAMPIMAPLADFAGVDPSLVVTAYQSASGLLNLVTPTSAVVMGGLAIARVPYGKYLRFVWPLLAILGGPDDRRARPRSRGMTPRVHPTRIRRRRGGALRDRSAFARRRSSASARWSAPGIFALLGAAGEVAGAAVWLSFLLAGAVAGLQGYSFAKFGVQVPVGRRAARVRRARVRRRPRHRRHRLADPRRQRHRHRHGRGVVRQLRQLGRSPTGRRRGSRSSPSLVVLVMTHAQRRRLDGRRPGPDGGRRSS